MLRSLLTALLVCCAVAYTGAHDALAVEDRQLSAAEIETLLTGNTVSGTWSGSAYKQYYGEGGFTMYVPEGGRADQGRWRVNPETDMYESWWQGSGWSPYAIHQMDDLYIWVSGSRREGFVVLPGKQVSW